MRKGKDKGAVVVLSGGQDSTTCLFWAKELFKEVLAVTFDYGQRHHSEIRAAAEIARIAEVEHVVFDLKDMGKFVKSALTDPSVEVKADGGHNNLPSTFVPGRNLVFSTIAAGIAVSRGWDAIVLGVCETDYSGYPDCRTKTINVVEEAIQLGMELPHFCVLTPLMHLTKSMTVRMMLQYGPKAWEALGLSVTCYNGVVPGCGKCPSCLLREKGFAMANVEDPARTQYKSGSEIKWEVP